MNNKAQLLSRINAKPTSHGYLRYVAALPFGPRLFIDHYRMDNGLDVLLLKDQRAPVISFHTWFRVGSRHEQPGKTGLAHLFEHLMFNEVEGLPPGEFDKRMEAAGADNNASTWLDFTQYQEAFPKRYLKTVIALEAKRMHQLRLRNQQVDSEKEVVKNERLFRVDDDVEGFVEELLWKTAFTTHAYHWPTIGWMSDIESFTVEDCRAFYRAYYAPNNAAVIVVGDIHEATTLSLLRDHYGEIASVPLPLEDIEPEPPQLEERRLSIEQPTTSHKLAVGYKGPALGDQDHILVSVLVEILAGGKASRLYQKLVRDLAIATDVAGFVGPHHHPSLIEFSCSARGVHTAEELLLEFDRQIDAILQEAVTGEELSQAIHRMQLATLCSLESADAKASSIGFNFTLLGAPGAVFDRLRVAERATAADLRFVARRYLNRSSRTIILVQPRAGALEPGHTEGAGEA